MKKEPIIFNHKNETVLMQPYVVVDAARFRFNKSAQELCGLKIGKRFTLLYFGDYEAERWTENEWYFIVDDDRNGIELKKEGRSSVLAQSMPIASKFMRHAIRAGANKESGTKVLGFAVESTIKEWKGKRLWKINIYAPHISSRARLKKDS